MVGGVSYLGRRNFKKMQGIRRNKKNGCVPTIMRFEVDVVFALSHSMVKIRKSCPEQMIFFVTEGARMESEIFERKSFQRLFNGVDVGEI